MLAMQKAKLQNIEKAMQCRNLKLMAHEMAALLGRVTRDGNGNTVLVPHLQDEEDETEEGQPAGVEVDAQPPTEGRRPAKKQRTVG